MKEVDIQRHVIDVVCKRGGTAYKLSHRFAIGVSDLLVKLPSTPLSPCGCDAVPAMLLEVKLAHGAPLDRNIVPREFKLDVTRPQEQFLRDFRRAGMRVGVLSFLEANGKLELYGAIFELDKLKAAGYRVSTIDHVPLRPVKERDAKLYQILEDYANG